MRPILVPVLGSALMLAMALTAYGSMDEPDAATLHGAPRVVRVEIDDVGADAGRKGVTPEVLATAVREQLTAAGFAVEPGAAAAIRVGIGVSLVRGAGLFAYSVRYSYEQPARLERDADTTFSAPTWQVVHTGSAFSAKLTETVIGTVNRLGERFLNSFGAVNPPGN